METWKEVFKGVIPPNRNYGIALKNGEEQGLVIELESKENKVRLDFGSTSAIRMIEEGVLLNGYVYNDEELKKYKPNNFSNVIYEIEGGDFGSFIHKEYGEMYEILNLKHYLIITMNYCVEVITQWRPEIIVLNK